VSCNDIALLLSSQLLFRNQYPVFRSILVFLAPEYKKSHLGFQVNGSILLTASANLARTCPILLLWGDYHS
jgi:hypothetical protein